MFLKKAFMGSIPITTTSPQLPPPSPLQLKLYQAFIFSVPVLFTIILVLLFYLFYIKRKTTTAAAAAAAATATATISSSNPSPLPPPIHTPLITTPFEFGLTKELRDNLPVIIFDESFTTRDSQCCVCLGDFQKNEHLHQILSCKHMFHVDCIHHWFMANTTCPLCRTSILPARKLEHSDPPAGSVIFRQPDTHSADPHLGSSHPQPIDRDDGEWQNLTNPMTEV